MLFRSKRRGVVTSALAIAYPILRFPLDFLRATDGEGGDVRYFGLTPGHFASLGMLTIGLLLAWRASKLPPLVEEPVAKKPEPGADDEGADSTTTKSAPLPPKALRLKKKPEGDAKA